MSTLKVNTLEEATSGGATYFTAKVWCTWQGTGTVSIDDDGNVSSVTDEGTGKYRANFSNSLSHANYATMGAAAKTDANDDGNANAQFNGNGNGDTNPNTTSKTHIRHTYNSTTTLADSGKLTLAVIL
tara:strand:- start:121 stop:504 length:384 start_codon:yes stop_codon:yes gene_type:complete